MIFDGYVACICEGAAEQAIMDLLLENNKLCFSSENLLTRNMIKCRSARTFEKTYLQKSFNDTITVLRILDSRRERFTLSPLYKDKVSVINIITAPEIEMLIIINENKYFQYKKSNMKPSEFCKSELKLKGVKSYSFVYSYFSDINKLIHCIHEYKRISKIINNEYTLYDLLTIP
ncbi:MULTISPECIES: hypothetical protein [unclassified Acetobacterium]|jgi:hypothetical protein|uniref:hypothetical protein n=1 Tax=unclassified Acetobacterium TaxID=2638182 RepID=UPI000DBEBF1F|nr:MULTISPECIES: hypothetical protein [unclassified Acetobacterium]AWW28442.1 hypothetical protein DOZ58_18370 [Acetobacterium sp. KB-1]MDZ5726797.1 hypothetical protein [Acetobacterium sp. K1/6]